MMTVHRPSDTATGSTNHRTPTLKQPVLIAAPTIRGQQAAPTIGHRHSHYTGRCATPRPPVLIAAPTIGHRHSHHTGRCAALPSLAIVTVHRPSEGNRQHTPSEGNRQHPPSGRQATDAGTSTAGNDDCTPTIRGQQAAPTIGHGNSNSLY